MIRRVVFGLICLVSNDFMLELIGYSNRYFMKMSCTCVLAGDYSIVVLAYQLDVHLMAELSHEHITGLKVKWREICI